MNVSEFYTRKCTSFGTVKHRGNSTSPWYTNTFSYNMGTYTEGRSRYVLYNDPLQKFYHGYYKLTCNRYYGDFQFSGCLEWTGDFGSAGYLTCSGRLGGFVVPSARLLYEAESKKSFLISKALKGAREEQVNIAMFIAELDDAAKLVGSSARKIAKAAGQVKAGKFTAAAKELGIAKPKGVRRSKAYADNLLAYKFGWSPLVADAVGAMKHLHRGAREFTIKSRARFTTFMGEHKWSGQTVAWQHMVNQRRLLATWGTTGLWEAHEQVRLVFALNSVFWDQVSRLGFMNPGALAWEAIPLSFVTDTFTNIGDVLADINRGLTLEFVTGSYTQYGRIDGSVTCRLGWFDLNRYDKYQKIEAFGPPDTPFESVVMVREVLKEAEIVTKWVLQSPLSVNNAITDVALVAQRLK